MLVAVLRMQAGFIRFLKRSQFFCQRKMRSDLRLIHKQFGLSYAKLGLVSKEIIYRVDMTIDGAVRVTNAKNNIILALSRSGAAAALIHPNGRVYHYGSRVEIQARHQQGNNKSVFFLPFPVQSVR